MLTFFIKELDPYNRIILIDYDYYVRFKDMRNSLYICDIDLLPSYARDKITLVNNPVCLKHCGLCLITNLTFPDALPGASPINTRA